MTWPLGHDYDRPQAPPARVVVRVTRGGRAARAGRLLRTAAGAGAAAARRRRRRHPARTSGPGRGGCGRALFEVIFVLYFLYLLKISKMRDADVNPFALNEDLTTSNENAAARSLEGNERDTPVSSFVPSFSSFIIQASLRTSAY